MSLPKAGLLIPFFFAANAFADGGDREDIVVPLAFFAMIAVMSIFRNRQRAQASKDRLEAIKVLAEKGQAIPPELLAESKDARPRRSPLARGILAISLGIGVGIYYLIKDPHGGQWAFGLGFLVAGIGNLWIAKKEGAKG